jgi:hypothetical protein
VFALENCSEITRNCARMVMQIFLAPCSFTLRVAVCNSHMGIWNSLACVETRKDLHVPNSAMVKGSLNKHECMTKRITICF